MKLVFFRWTIILFLLFTGNTYGQIFGVPKEKIDTTVFMHLPLCSSDNDPVSNESESAYLNALQSPLKRPYSFSNKKIAFVTGSSARIVSDKEAYFNLEKSDSRRIPL